jgi:DNA-binding NtrC family response regulator
VGPSIQTKSGTSETLSQKDRLTGHTYLFRIFQCEQPLAPSTRHALGEYRAVTIGRGERTTSYRDAVGDRVGPRLLKLEVADSWMSATHVRINDVLGRWTLEDLGSKNGTFVNSQRVTRAVLSDGDVLEVGRTFFIYRDGLPGSEIKELDSGHLDAVAANLTTLLPPLAQQFASVAQVARAMVSVMIRGETGTGKELVARALHQLSGRTGRFVAVTCGAIPATLVESELFGHQKGAFSGATQSRPGLIRSAERGTLFLDEVGDLPIPSQASLLRVLQEREVMPLGGTEPVGIDVRFCAATHRNLEELVSRKEFREDLYARICGMTVHLPQLRERREDLGILIASLLQRVAPKEASSLVFHRKAARAIFRYPWPLNIREIEKALETAVSLARGQEIRLEHLPEPVRATLPATERDKPDLQIRRRSGSDETLRAELIRLLSEHHGNLSAVARSMSSHRMQIRRWLKRFGIEVQQYR